MTEAKKFALLVSGPRDESYDPPAVFGPFDSVAEAETFAADFREANDLPRSYTPYDEEWSEAGWYFGIAELTLKIERWVSA